MPGRRGGGASRALIPVPLGTPRDAVAARRLLRMHHRRGVPALIAVRPAASRRVSCRHPFRPLAEPRAPPTHDVRSRPDRRARPRPRTGVAPRAREPARARRSRHARLDARRRDGDRAVRGPGAEPGARRGGPRAEEDESQLLHDRLRRPRGERRARRTAAAHRSRVPPLPVRGADDGARAPAARLARRRSTRCSASLPSAEDPISGGRHKVWGSRALWVPPQTSTIASHLPKATGTAFSLARARRMGVATDLPTRRDRGRLVRRREREPRHRAGGHQHRPLRGAARTAMPDPVRLRGQRDRDQRADPARAGSRRASGRSPICATCWPTGRSTRSGRPRPRRSATSGAPASRHSSTSRRSACGATRVRTRSRCIARPRRSPRSRTVIPSSAPRAASSRSAQRAPRSCGRSWPTPGTASRARRRRRRDGRGSRRRPRWWRRSRPRTPSVLPSALPAAT